MHAPASPAESLAPLVLGTANRKKAAELVDLVAPFGLSLATLADFPAALDVDESGNSFEENAKLKATLQAAHLGRWVLADDSGLAVDALGGAPGVISARYAGPGATDEANRRKLLAELNNVPPETAHSPFRLPSRLGRSAGRGPRHGHRPLPGRIRHEDSGSGGFGYDPLFEVVEYHRTFGELSPAVKGVLSHRRGPSMRLPRSFALVEAGEFRPRD